MTAFRISLLALAAAAALACATPQVSRAFQDCLTAARASDWRDDPAFACNWMALRTDGDRLSGLYSYKEPFFVGNMWLLAPHGGEGWLVVNTIETERFHTCGIQTSHIERQADALVAHLDDAPAEEGACMVRIAPTASGVTVQGEGEACARYCGLHGSFEGGYVPARPPALGPR